MRVVEAEQLQARVGRADLGAPVFVRAHEEPAALLVGERVVERERVASPGPAPDRAARRSIRSGRFARRDGGARRAPVRQSAGAAVRLPRRVVVGRLRRVPQRIREVPVAAVGEDGDDDALAERVGDVEGRGQGRAARRADEQPFFTREPARQRVRVLGGDARVDVGQRRVVDRRERSPTPCA